MTGHQEVTLTGHQGEKGISDRASRGNRASGSDRASMGNRASRSERASRREGHQ